MPLKLTLSKGEKFIVNGAVIKNDGDGASLVFENQAHILRQKDILTAESAKTPAARVYLALQCAYMFPERQDSHLKDFHRLLDDFAHAAPSAQEIVDEVRMRADEGQLYHALKSCRQLIEHEGNLLTHA